MNRNRKLFWEELSNTKVVKVESCSRIKDGKGMETISEESLLEELRLR